MIDYDVLTKILDDKVVYIKTDTEIGDFLRTSRAVMQVHGKTLRLDIPLAEREIRGLMQNLMLSLFSEAKTIIFWDVKPLVTYMKHRSNNFEIKSKVIDLKLLESFVGISHKAPVSWSEAMKRTQHCTNQKNAMDIHKKIHIPLALKVIPDLETNGIANPKKGRTLYSSYEIEGQTTGRLRCTQPTPVYLNPHTLDPDDEEVGGLIPLPHDLFVSFDFKNMEVAVLQHLSKDEVLGKIIADASKDVYVEIYKTVTGFQEVDPKNARNIAKSFFLPIVYGQGPSSLMDSLGIDEATARELHITTVRKFPQVFSWVSDQHEQAEKTSRVIDCFGRVRVFEEKMYRARHFVIAAPAAILCMEKLIKLHAELPKDARLIFSIHDGYYMTTNRANYREVCIAARQILEQPTELLPNFSLKVSCSIGKTLSDMRKYI